MATTKITDLSAYTDPVNTDVLPIVDVTSDVTKKVSIANVMKNASLGSASAPGVAFDGDPNTGIYSPGADQVAVSTGGTQRLLIDSSGAVTIAGDLTVNGTTTNINTQNLVVEDKNVVLGDVATPTDVTADGGGITLKGTTDKTINWVDATDAWTSSEHINIASGKEYRIAGTKVLDATSLGSSVLITSANITDGTIVNGDISASAAIDKTKISGTAITAADSGTVTSTMIADGTIVNGDINASAAIAGTKISPDFGSQTITTTGVVSAALGAAATPSLTFTADPNTGIYSPGADQLAISTGGSGRLFINSSGQVGVGTVPGSTFDLSGTTSRIRWDLNNAYTLATHGNAAFSAFAPSVQSAADFQYQIAGTEKMRLDSSGRLGVGTSTPGALLELSSSSTPQLFISNTSNSISSGGTIGTIDYRAGSSNTVVARMGATADSANEDGAHIVFENRTGGGAFSEKVRITSAGLVGIGTSSPASTLSVGGNAPLAGAIGAVCSAGGIALSLSDNVNSSLHVRTANGGAIIGTDAGGVLRFATNGVATTDERARIDTSGRLLVGATGPLASITASFAGTAYTQTGGGGDIYSGQIIEVIDNNSSTFGANKSVAYGFNLNCGGGFSTHAKIALVKDNGTSGNQSAHLQFWTRNGANNSTNDAERMRITSSGSIAWGSNISSLYNFLASDGAIVSRTTYDTYTTASAANVHLATNYYFYRSTSSIKYKTNVETIEDQYSDAILNCRPVWYQSICKGDNPDWGYWGFIAEEVAEVDPRLVFWKTHETVRDEDGTETSVELEEPLAEGVQYDRFVPHLLNLIKRQQQAIEDLQAEVAALKAQ